MDQNNYNYTQQNEPGNYNMVPVDQQDPVTFSQWMLTLFFMLIPIVNFVMLIVWITSDETQPSKKNWAKAQLIWMIVSMIIGFTFSFFIRTAILGFLGGLF